MSVGGRQPPSRCSSWVKTLVEYRETIVSVTVPLVLLPLIFYVGTKEAKAIYLIILMVFYWNFEVVPIGITALIPVVLVPLLGILPGRDICAAYFKETNMLFLGGLVLQVCIETWNLHKRVAIRLLQVFGVEPRWLLFGFMIPPWILSMWMANTACVALMLPFAEATLVELRRHFQPLRPSAASNRKSQISRTNTSSYDVTNCPEVAAEADGAANPALEMTNYAPVIEPNGDDSSASHNHVVGLQMEQELRPSSLSALEHHAEGEVFNNGVGGSSSLGGGNTAKPQEEEEEPYMIHEIETRRILREALADTKKSDYLDVARMLVLSMPFGAYFGGVASLSGTSPNAVLVSTVQEYFGTKTSLTYVNWLGFGMPISVVTFLIGWVWLQISFLGFRGLVRPRLPEREVKRVSKALRRNYEILGPMTYAEVNVLIIFLGTIFLWFTREQGLPGWSIVFFGLDPKSSVGAIMNYMSNAQPSIFAAALLFFLPSRNPWTCCARSRKNCGENYDAARDVPTPDRPARLMSWKQMQEKLGWILVLCLGAGFGLTEVSKACNLSDWLGQPFMYLRAIPQEALLFIVCLFTALLTEWTSNQTSAYTMLPMLAKFAPKLGVNPLYFMVPCTASCSFAFSLPVTVPAHILIYSRGYLRVVDALRTGSVLWLLSNSIVTVAGITYAPAIFGLKEFPAWAMQSNATALG